MKNVITLGLVVVWLVFSCSDGRELLKEGILLKQVNDDVARDNQCKLTFHFSKQKPDQLVIILGNPYNDEYLPGKVIYEYYLGISKRNFKLKEFQLQNFKGEVLYELSSKQLDILRKKVKHGSKIMTYLSEDNTDKIYAHLDTTIVNKIRKEEFVNQFKSIKTSQAVFVGFQTFPDYYSISYRDTDNQYFLIYSIDPDKNKIFGFTVR